MGCESDYFAEAARKEAAFIADAEARARAEGKELWDLDVFETTFNRGSQKANERAHRLDYYRSELKTLATFADHQREAYDASR